MSDLFVGDWAAFEPPDLDEKPPATNGNGHKPAKKTPRRRTVKPKPPEAHVGVVQSNGAIAVNNPADVTDWLRLEVGRGKLAGVFKRGDRLVYTPQEGEDGYRPPKTKGDHDGPAQVQPIDGARLASRCQYTYRCVRVVQDDDGKWRQNNAIFPATAARIPVDVPDMLPNVRPLAGVVHSPVLRADGSLLDQPGYDARTGLLHLPEPGLTIPPVPYSPTEMDVRRAVRLLSAMLEGFVFASDSDRANFFGLLLTPTLRTLLPPPYKLGAIGAPMPGSGKSLLAALLRIVHGGVFRAEVPDEEAELRKQVSTILEVTTGPVVQFDNATGVLRSSTLAALLTSAEWDDRQLGSNRMVRAVNDRLWIVTGNNLTLGGDLVRRTLWVTIDPGVPDPHLRTGFKIVDLENWARTNRGEILHAILVLARAWVDAGMPSKLDRSDSYAHWTAALRGLLAHAGIAGKFDESTTARQQVGADDSEWSGFLLAIHKTCGATPWTVAELVNRISTNGGMDSRPISADALPGELADKFDRQHSITRSLGRWLMNREGRYAGDLVIRAAGETRDHIRYWRVERWQASDDGGAAA